MPPPGGTIPETRSLSDEQRNRLAMDARDVSARAYCPYSRFPVGAVVLADDGRTFAACNVENASYGLTVCAERSAVFAAVAAGVRGLRAVVIYTRSGKPTPPCGACRQVLVEFGPDLTIISRTEAGDEGRWELADLLPSAFGPSDLRGEGRRPP